MFPKYLTNNSFYIVNTDLSNEEGMHWVVFVNKKHNLNFGDSMGNPMIYYKNIKINKNILIHHISNQRIQREELCGLYCIYFAYLLFSQVTEYDLDDNSLMRFFSQYL